jgi:prepilin-type N-terminal cleavage/methylation domain-containing protein
VATDHSNGKSRQAFTLVELLVVIGIIAVLISILLPAMNRARQAAVKTQCLSNLRDMGNSLQMYANEFKDRVPIGQNSIVRDSHYFSVAAAATTDPVYVCAGPVYVAGHVKDARSWFCPSPNIIDPRWMFDSDQNRWPPAPVTNPQVRMGYYLRPGFSFGGGSALGVPPKLINRAPSTAKIWPNQWPQLSQFKSKAIAADLWPIPQGSVAKDSPHGKTLNVLFGDRSAQMISIDNDLKKKIEYLQLDTNNQHIWNEYLSETPAGVTNTKGLWILFDMERQ